MSSVDAYIEITPGLSHSVDVLIEGTPDDLLSSTVEIDTMVSRSVVVLTVVGDTLEL